MPTPEVSYRMRIPPAAPSHPPFRPQSYMDRLPRPSHSPFEFTQEPQQKRHCQGLNLTHPHYLQAPARSPPYTYGNRGPIQPRHEMPYSIARFVGLEGPYNTHPSNNQQREENIGYSYFR